MGQEIQSREYKIMLDANRFEGSEDALRAQAARFWEVFGKAVAEVTDGSVRTKKKLKKIDADKRRKIRFYDTEDCFLDSAHDYVFRLREEVISGKEEVTLKFRQRKLRTAQMADMQPADTGGAECNRIEGFTCKFEEDVKVDSPIVSLYSVSTTKEIGPGEKIAHLNYPGDFVPGLQNALGEEYHPERRIKRVGKYTARELVLTGGRLEMSKWPDVKVGCGLVVWYDNSKKPFYEPDVAEFSFKYRKHIDDELLESQCREVLTILNDRMGTWVASPQLTKTRFVYEKQECLSRVRSPAG